MKKSKLILLISAAVLSINIVNAQTVKPQFKGGKEALKKYLEKDFVMLADEPVDHAIGVRFLVGKSGLITSVTVISEADQHIKDKAIQIVKTMPKWEPGKQKGVATAVYDTLNLAFWTPPVIVADDEIDEEEPFTIFEQMPYYPRGQKEMMKFISDNLRYPEEAVKEGIEGRVFVKFVVKKDGNISDVEVFRGLDPSCDKEAVRVVKLMPKWVPGIQNGKVADVYYTLPIVFKLPKEEIDAVDIAELQEHKVVVAEPSDREKPFVIVEQMPQYPGGQEEMMKFISDNLKYPEAAVKEGIEGRVILRFVVRKDGNVSDVEVLRGLDPSCDKEAVRVIKSMPKWVPGRQNGQAVDVYFTLPVRFKLTREENEKK